MKSCCYLGLQIFTMCLLPLKPCAQAQPWSGGLAVSRLWLNSVILRVLPNLNNSVIPGLSGCSHSAWSPCCLLTVDSTIRSLSLQFMYQNIPELSQLTLVWSSPPALWSHKEGLVVWTATVTLTSHSTLEMFSLLPSALNTGNTEHGQTPDLLLA